MMRAHIAIVGRALLASAALAFPLAAIGAEARAPARVVERDDVVSLPPLLVEANLGPMSWRYVEWPGREVLSVCSDAITKDFVRRCFRLEQMLQLILPARFQAQSSVSDIQILFGEELARARSREVVAEMLKREGAVLLPSGSLAPALGSGLPGPGGREGMGRPVFFLPNLRLWDVDATAVFAALRESEATQMQFMFVEDRIAFLLEHRVPALPDWLVEGIIGIYGGTRFQDDAIVIPPARWFSEMETQALATDPDRPRTLLPMVEMLGGRRTGKGEDPGESGGVWRSQCALFARWALTSRNGARRQALWDFVDRLEQETPSEELFRACFNMGYSDARDRLSDYLPLAVRDEARIAVPKLPEPPPLKVRAATEVEIARIRGDWERMEIAFVKIRFPSLTGQYVEQARRTLWTAYDQGARDPRLLAVMGLTECDAGNRADARAYLEAAALAQVVRPRVYVELARLRLAELQGTSVDHRLSDGQVAKVLEPLLVARRLQPPLLELYGIMAEVWSRSEAAPTPEDLAILDEGARLFPRASPFLFRAIYLNVSNGQIEPAIALASLGLRHARDPAIRDRFARVLARLQDGGREG